ncbi:hypothetical protein IU459_29530 [Nocardia amamiensis]|uniref:Uncharacterized protein n=1 Tax=Nocardia amamiensis TaxID=404578 RepID=A0ABS0CYR5_9NOCA|nr:hypothetical protein [Nocardia amamiensis]MBF6301650.1 hypothetical protein [Nocardia amamiensis]
MDALRSPVMFYGSDADPRHLLNTEKATHIETLHGLTEDQRFLLAAMGSGQIAYALGSHWGMEYLFDSHAGGTIHTAVEMLRPEWEHGWYDVMRGRIELEVGGEVVVKLTRRRMETYAAALPEDLRATLYASYRNRDDDVLDRMVWDALALPPRPDLPPVRPSTRPRGYSSHMETIPEAETDEQPDDEDGGGEETASCHYSTGRLTSAQARTVNTWRQQLTLTDPQWNTPNQRPLASSSDCIAAAVTDLLDRARPGHLELVRYADRMREQQRANRAGTFPAGSVVSFYLPPSYADRLDQLLTDAQQHHADTLDQAREQVLAELPGRANATTRVMRMMSVVGSLNIPIKAYRLPAGTLARMAIDRWADKPAATVVAAAVAYGREYHAQQHRARKDMGVG